jgi:hypothetical protein
MAIVLGRLARLGFRTPLWIAPGGKAIGSSADVDWDEKCDDAIFDIRARTGYFEGADWVADPRRFAHIYVFAYHPIMEESADHRDPRQWRFHVVATNRLPAGKTINLVKVALLSEAVPWIGLRAAIENLRAAL